MQNRFVDLDQEAADIRMQRILVLEDDPDFSAVLATFLESVPYHAVAVANGVDGLKKVMSQTFDAVICDMMMPRLSGDMFYAAVQRVKPALCPRFLFITGHRADERINTFIRSVRGTIIHKPFHMADLKESLDFVLRR